MKNMLFSCLFAMSVLQIQAQSITSPAQFLGYQPGDRFTRHHKIVQYFEKVNQERTNVVIEYYGETNEHRPLLVAIVSSQENINNLEQIRKDNLIRTGLLVGSPSATQIGIVWLSYNVHGNEASSSEATMQTLYELANPSNAKTQEWLKNTIVIIDPCINPDGRDRYANFYNQFGDNVANANLDAKEHHEPWPGGRVNHYLFDLNRDWAWQTQVESAQRMVLYNQWMPQIHVDFHEQGINSPYYFAPAAEPYHKVITSWQREFQNKIGTNHAKYFDEEGWLYFTKERFDLLYPSYGDSYPIFNGAIGMTYEQAGHSRGGRAALLDNGDTLTLKDRIAHHLATGLSTVEIASKSNERLVNEFESFFKSSINNPKVKYKSFIVKRSNNKDKINSLKDLLDKQLIRYGTVADARKLTGYDFITNKSSSFNVQPGDLVVSVFQPKGTLASVLFEPKTEISDSMTYDITAWGLPYVYGLDAYASETRLQVSPLQEKASVADRKILKRPYAFVTNYASFDDQRFLAVLLQKGINVRSIDQAITLEGKHFERGALIVLRADNKHNEGYETIVRNEARLLNREIVEKKTGLADKGIDMGSSHVRLIKKPVIALMSGNDVSPTAFGELWHYFETQLAYPVTVLGTDYFNDMNLWDYNVLILPNGRYRGIDEDQLEIISRWVSDGGKLILLEGALRTVVDKDGFALKSTLEEKKEEEPEEPEQKRYENRQRDRLSDNIPGAIYNVTIDNSHPLVYGYGNSFYTLKRSAAKYVMLKNGWNVGVLSDPHPVSGFAGHKTIAKLEKTLVMGVESKGAGEIIYLVDDPVFRAFWYSGKLMLGNAVFLVGK